MSHADTTNVTHLHTMTWAAMLFAASQPGSGVSTDPDQVSDEVRLVLQEFSESNAGGNHGATGAVSTERLVDTWAASLVEAVGSDSAPYSSLDAAQDKVRELLATSFSAVN